MACPKFQNGPKNALRPLGVNSTRGALERQVQASEDKIQ
jgi:hypothetical protein